jgi:hypothetical protein
MSRTVLLDPPYADQAGALLARMMPGDVPPNGVFRMFAKNLPMAGAMHGQGRRPQRQVLPGQRHRRSDPRRGH